MNSPTLIVFTTADQTQYLSRCEDIGETFEQPASLGLRSKKTSRYLPSLFWPCVGIRGNAFVGYTLLFDRHELRALAGKAATIHTGQLLRTFPTEDLEVLKDVWLHCDAL